jgi:protein-S-isoprenylcysteine O-methyltransferase Ste14
MTQITERSAGTSAPHDGETAGIRVPPPLLFAGPLAVGLLLNRWFPIPVPASALIRLSGATLALGGSGLLLTADREMFSAGNNPNPAVPVKRIVTGGPYRYTRNPIYLGFALVYAGVSLIARAPWPLFLLPAALARVSKDVVRLEEEYLERRFGDTYREYKVRVRRWV